MHCLDSVPVRLLKYHKRFNCKFIRSIKTLPFLDDTVAFRFVSQQSQTFVVFHLTDGYYIVALLVSGPGILRYFKRITLQLLVRHRPIFWRALGLGPPTTTII